MEVPPWIPRARDYQKEQTTLSTFSRRRVAQHPLKRATTFRTTTAPTAGAAAASPLPPSQLQRASSGLAKAGAKAAAVNPLAARNSVSLNPLANPLARNDPPGATITTGVSELIAHKQELSYLELNRNASLPSQQARESAPCALADVWTKEMRNDVLLRYQFSGRVAFNHDAKALVLDDTKSIKVDRNAIRIQQLEEEQRAKAAAAGGGTANVSMLTQSEFTNQVSKFCSELIAAWNREARVDALKLAIQCAKTLAETGAPQFYPSMFVLVTDVLNMFGNLVHERITQRSRQQSGDNYDPYVEAIETCRNWLYKVASIRELLPRVYIELALLQTTSFLPDFSFAKTLDRLSCTIRGLGDPLVSAYARLYLSQRAATLAPTLMSYRPTLFSDLMRTISDFDSGVTEQLRALHLSKTEYLFLFSPVVDFLCRSIGEACSEAQFQELLNQYSLTSDSALVLTHLISAMPAKIVSSHAAVLVAQVRDLDKSYPTHRLYAAFGRKFTEVPPAPEERLPLLNDIWKHVTKITDASQYVVVVEAFFPYLLKCFSAREVDVLLGDLLKHATAARSFEEISGKLHQIVNMVIEAYRVDFQQLMALENFLPLLDLFQNESRADVSRRVLDAFVRRASSTADTVVQHAIFEIGKTLHDSIDSLTPEDEQRAVADLIRKFLHKLDFGNDVEAQLTFFVECREAFPNLGVVKSELVQLVCGLAMKTFKMMRGRHTKRSLTFVKACFAYCFITIPSMEELLPRLHLLHLCGQTALMNGLLVLADNFYKTIITLISDVEKTQEVVSEPLLVEFLRALLGSLLVLPGHPKFGPFYIVQGLVTVLKEYKWAPGGDSRARVFIDMLGLLSASAQPSFITHIAKVESNDTLFGSTPEYTQATRDVLQDLLQCVLDDMTQLSQSPQAQTKALVGPLAVQLFARLVSCAGPECHGLALNLLNLAKKNGVAASRLQSEVAHTAALARLLTTTNSPAAGAMRQLQQLLSQIL